MWPVSFLTLLLFTPQSGHKGTLRAPGVATISMAATVGSASATNGCWSETDGSGLVTTPTVATDGAGLASDGSGSATDGSGVATDGSGLVTISMVVTGGSGSATDGRGAATDAGGLATAGSNTSHKEADGREETRRDLEVLLVYITICDHPLSRFELYRIPTSALRSSIPAPSYGTSLRG